MMDFFVQKHERLQKDDLSKKGSIDFKILELVNFINKQECFVTTSSCSGRTIIFSNTESKKKGCIWKFVSHDIVSDQTVMEALECDSGECTLKFEPFILHVQCLSIEDAQNLHSISIQSGFRNSGITIGRKGKVIMAIRSTLSLEVPLSHDGKLLVSPEYISYIVSKCNEKMKENWCRIERLSSNLKDFVPHSKKMSLIKQLDETFPLKKPFPNSKLSLPKDIPEEDNCVDSFYDGFDCLLNSAIS